MQHADGKWDIWIKTIEFFDGNSARTTCPGNSMLHRRDILGG